MKKIAIVISVMLFISCSKKVSVITELPIENQEIYEIPEQESVPMVIFKEEKPEIVKTVVVYFKFDSDELQDNEKWKLSNIENVIDLTCGCCPVGTDDYNYTLGIKRCIAVKKYFEYKNIKINRYISLGERDLLTTDKNKYYFNRRCEVRYK